MLQAMHPVDIDLGRASIIPMGHPVPGASAATGPLGEAALSASRLPAAVARRAQFDLDRLEMAEAGHHSAQNTKRGVAALAAGFAFAVFPFTPGLVSSCRPTHNPGWQCGARAASFLAAIEAAITCVCTLRALYSERGVVAARAAAMGLALQRDAIRHGGELPSPGFFGAFLGASAEGRQRLRENLEDAVMRA